MKISEFSEIQLSTLDETDLFYIVDNISGDIKQSKKITYGSLLSSISLSAGYRAITDVSVDNDNRVLSITFDLKRGGSKTISVSLSGIVNMYEGDNTYIKIDDKTGIISLDLSNTMLSACANGENIIYTYKDSVSSYILSCGGSSYYGGNGISLDVDTKTFSISNDYLTANALDGLSDNWNSAYTVVSSLAQNGKQIDCNKLALSSYNNVFNEVKEELSTKGYCTLIRAWHHL